MSKVILVTSGKGGTGKTTFTVNMGATLAQHGARVLLIDMDMGLRNLDLYLGMENKVVYNLMDVLSGVCGITKAIIGVDGFDKLYFMAATPGKDDRDITSLHMKVLCQKLDDVFDFIIIDCPAGIGDLLDVSCEVADKAVLVTEPEIAALRDADTTERYIRSKGITDSYIVLNKLKVNLIKEGLLPGIDTIRSLFQVPVTGLIPDDDNIRISTNRGVPIVSKKGTYIEKNFTEIVRRILE